MDVSAFSDAAAFYRAASHLLLQGEAEYYLMIGIALRLSQGADDAWSSGEPPLFRTVSDGERVVAAALQLPPRYLMITRARDAVVSALVEHLQNNNIQVAGVSGPQETASGFAHAWSRRTGQQPALQATERIYQATQVTIPSVPGYAEVASQEDYDLLLAWSGPDNASHVRRCVGEGRTLLWRDPIPVSMATVTRATPHGIGIGGVYTPPEYRRQGYGSAVVAAISQRQLDAGRRFCFLCADLADPHAHSIYLNVGYYPVCDYAAYRLS